ncbi:carbohydrate-binding module family 18 protein [Gigaspora margarita]|uniref:Carbohydrate-binding module family 18 protein n=2 Tax=Gigaspora margarita TaxID=4874 RepID=A0A8H4A984_GIGMA|nr:carbohydrate-binding module family 18 protein [Gigaspora margarita]
MAGQRNISLAMLLSLSILFYVAFLTTNVQSASCGPNGDNARCLAGYCCSKDGFCGITSTFCGRDCDPNYGVCGEIIISSTATTVIPSPTKLSEANGHKKNSLGILFLVVLVAVILL